MLYQLYFKARSYFVTSLVDNDWDNTLSFLQTMGQLNAVYAVAGEGSLSKRIERFNKLRASGHASEQDKNSFAQGLLVIDGSEQNIIAKTVAAIIWNPHSINEMLDNLDAVGFFVGAEASTRLLYFLEAFFASDSRGRCAFLYLLNPKYLDSLSVVLNKLFKHNDFGRVHQDYLLNAITAHDQLLFRSAAQNSSSYLLVRQALLKTGYSGSQLATLLNTAYPEYLFEREIRCTPLMMLIYNTIRYSQRNYADFAALLLRFRADGAQLTARQAQMMRQHLEEIKSVVDISATHVALLNDYITMLQDMEEPEPIAHSAVAPKLKPVSTTSLVNRTRKPAVDLFVEDDAEVSRVLNLV